MTSVCFIHDAPLFHCLPEDTIYSQGFDYTIWERYLQVFESIIVCTRIRNVDKSNLSISSGPGVRFEPVSAYRNIKDIVFNLPKIMKQLLTAINVADTVIIRLPSVLGWIGFFLAKMKRKSILIELVGCPKDAYSNLGWFGKIVAPLAAALTRFQIKNVGFSIYVTRNYLQGKYPCNGTTAAISNVQLKDTEKEFTYTATDFDKPLKIGSVGQIDLKYKGFQTMIAALADLPEAQYEIVGRGNQNYLRDLAKNLGVFDRVSFQGALSHDEVMTWLESLDIFVQPSFTEGLPRAVIEAMSKGLPVVGSRVGGIPELIDSEWTFPPGDATALSDTIDKLKTVENRRISSFINLQKSANYNSQILQNKRAEILSEFKEDHLFNKEQGTIRLKFGNRKNLD